MVDAIACCISTAVRNGWGVSDAAPIGISMSDFEAAIRVFGEPLIARTRKAGAEVLTPTESQCAKKASLSKAYGLGAFPYHTDAAHWPRPPRYLVLYGYSDEQERPTVLVPWVDVLDRLSSVNSDAVMRATFLVRSGKHSHYCAMNLGEPHLVRLDFTCMTPATEDGYALKRECAEYLLSVLPEKVYWRPGRVAVIDNWAILHGRGLRESIGERILYRALLDVRGDLR